MIDLFSASVLANRMISKSKNFMRSNGFVSPFLFAVKRDGPFQEFEHEGVLAMECDPLPDESGLYRVIAILQMRTPSDQKYQEEVSRYLAETSSAEVIGLMVRLLYKRSLGERPKSLDTDPEATDLLHGCFYMRGEPEPYVIQLPLNDRGNVKDADLSSHEPGKSPFDISFASTCWVRQDEVNTPKFPYPFRT